MPSPRDITSQTMKGIRPIGDTDARAIRRPQDGAVTGETHHVDAGYNAVAI